MVVNEYVNLYESDYYKNKASLYNFNRNDNGLNKFENDFVIANAIYVESKNCYELRDDGIYIKKSELINRFLSEHLNVIDILNEVYEFEKRTNKGDFISAIELCVMVCESHLNDLNNEMKLKLVN